MKYQNRLDQFQSHSVHYVVLAARSTEAVRAFTATDAQSQKQALLAIDGAKKLGEKLAVPGRQSEGAYLMIDTRRFSQFTIDNFSLNTLVAGFSVPGSKNPSSTAIAMSFDVVDSVGISFANFLQWMMDQQLQVNFDGLTVLVKLLFVGHKADGSSETVQSLTIPAIFNKIQVQLTDTRGIYACELFPLIGTASNSRFNAKWTHIGNASSFFTGVSANTLGAVIDSFEKRLNEESLTYYNQVNVQSQQAGAENKAQPANKKFGRPVQYMITIPDSWRKFKFNGPSTHSAAEIDFAALLKAEEATRAAKANAAQQQRSTSAKQTSEPTPQDSYVSVDSTMSITEVLDFIFKQTAEVMKLGNFSKTAVGDSVKFYKNLISITSDDSSIVVHVDVFEFEVPNVYLSQNSKAPVTNADQNLFTVNPVTGKKEPKNFIELDYLFSGTNVDVLDLDLKIENLVYLLADKSKLGQSATYVTADSGQGQSDDGEGVKKDDVVTNMRAKDPVIMPMKTEAERTNYSAFNSATGPADADDSPQTLSQRYLRNLSAFYNLGPYDAKLELRGNPDLMVFVTLTDLQQHVSSTEAGAGGALSTNASVKSTYRQNIEDSILKSNTGTMVRAGSGALKVQFDGPKFVSTPVFVKVNVFGPNVDFATNELVQGAAFQQRLLFDNYYFLTSITSKVSGSRFTHELELKPFTMYGVSTVTAAGAQTVKVDRVRGGQ